MKNYLLTEEDRTEILKLIRSRSLLGAQNYLNQLPELKQKKEIYLKKIIYKLIIEKKKITDKEAEEMAKIIKEIEGEKKK